MATRYAAVVGPHEEVFVRVFDRFEDAEAAAAKRYDELLFSGRGSQFCAVEVLDFDAAGVLTHVAGGTPATDEDRAFYRA